MFPKVMGVFPSWTRTPYNVRKKKDEPKVMHYERDNSNPTHLEELDRDEGSDENDEEKKECHVEESGDGAKNSELEHR